MAEKSAAAVAEPYHATEERRKEKTDEKRKRQPRYHVVLWNDDDHTFDYVIRMMQELFHHAKERGKQIAKEVDSSGRAVVLTTTREHAELKRDQIHAFGADKLISRCKGSMSASIEPETT